MVVEIILLDAWTETLDVDVAYLSRSRWLIVVAVVDVGSSAGRQTRLSVNCYISIVSKNTKPLSDTKNLSQHLPSRKLSRESTQWAKFLRSVPLYHINVLSTFSTGGIGLNPRPDKKLTQIFEDYVQLCGFEKGGELILEPVSALVT